MQRKFESIRKSLDIETKKKLRQYFSWFSSILKLLENSFSDRFKRNYNCQKEDFN